METYMIVFILIAVISSIFLLIVLYRMCKNKCIDDTSEITYIQVQDTVRVPLSHSHRHRAFPNDSVSEEEKHIEEPLFANRS